MRGLGLTPVAATAAAVGALAAAPTAQADSILYEKAGKLWLASPDGKVQRRVRHTGRFESPSQADNGVIVAQRGLQFFRLNRAGRLLNRPVTPAFRRNPATRDFDGPFWPEVSPNGRLIAYTYFFGLSQFDPACACNRVVPSLNTAYTYSNREVARPDEVFGTPSHYQRASWIDNRRVLLSSLGFTDFTGRFLTSVAIDTLGGAGRHSYTPWFNDCAQGCDSPVTAVRVPLDDGEITRRRDRAVFVAGQPGEAEPGAFLRIYRLAGLPPAVPLGACDIQGSTGRFRTPSWSPDGRSLAWADDRGIWVGRLTSVDGSTCSVRRRLLVRGGSSPDWGPAGVR